MDFNNVDQSKLNATPKVQLKANPYVSGQRKVTEIQARKEAIESKKPLTS